MVHCCEMGDFKFQTLDAACSLRMSDEENPELRPWIRGHEASSKAALLLPRTWAMGLN
jgi:hypothetical protein